MLMSSRLRLDIEAHLQQGSSQVDRREDGGQGGVAALHQVYCIQEDRVTGNYQEKQHLSRAMVCS